MINDIVHKLLLAGLFFIKYSKSYPDGAPVEACYNFRPGHGFDFSTQADVKTMYSLSAKSTGSKDKGVQVTIKAMKGSRPFKGFIIRALPGKYDISMWEDEAMPVGSWKNSQDTKSLNCFRGENNAITHVDNDPKSEAMFMWIPPKSHGKTVGNITFVATVVENFNRYWTGLDSGIVNF